MSLGIQLACYYILALAVHLYTPNLRIYMYVFVQVLNLSTILATQLLLVDEVMKAGKSMGQPAQQPGGMEDME